MKILFDHFKSLLLLLAMFCMTVSISSCSDDDDIIEPQITVNENSKNISVTWDEIETSIKFTSATAWTATVKDASGVTCTWIKLSKYEGDGGDVSIPMLFEANDARVNRSAVITLVSGEVSSLINVVQGDNPDAAQIMSESDVADFYKYYKPEEFKNINMLRSDAKWSWFRHKQSEHFFVFWEEGFGEDPNAETVDPALSVDIDDLLAKAEQFYNTNINILKFAETGSGVSNIGKYKMQIYLHYTTEWMAYGGGYDDVIGALWINPGTCKPVGSTIAHEIGHSFQYQVYCDKLLNGAANDFSQGFRYAHGNGSAFWEQSAQWQSLQDYPTQIFGGDLSIFKANSHRHFNHEWMRYASYWLHYYWAQKHGITAVAEVWKQSYQPEDPLMTYQRLYCNGNLDQLYEELYDYASRMVIYDIDVIRNYRTESAQNNHSTKMYETTAGYYQVGYASTPGTSGFNIIPLNLPEGDNTISVAFEGLATGSSLSDLDPGTQIDSNGKTVANVRNYNANSNTDAGWRYGFVSVINGTAQYSPMYKNKSETVSYTVPAGTTHLYMVVLGAPGTYESHLWNEDESDDAQWPYKVKFSGTDLLGSFLVDETADPQDVTVTYDLSCDANSGDWALGSINLALSQRLAQAFALKPSTLEGKIMSIGSQPEEGKIAVTLQQTDGSYADTSTANNGFWCSMEGDNVGYGSGTVFCEFSGLTISYGHKPNDLTTQGNLIVLKPTFIYTKNGMEYKATIVLNMQF